MKYKILAGRLTAHPNNHGTHLDNYVADKYQIAKSVCEGLILHDQICIPIQDYLTACGLISILGENNVISLLESEQIKFLRSRHGIVLINSRNLPTDIALMTADEHHPRSSPNDESIASGFEVLEKSISLKNKNLLEKLLLRQTDSVDIHEGIKEIKKRTFKTFEFNPISRKPINDFLDELATGKAEVTTLGNDPIDINNPIKVTIGLANVHYETYLLNKYNCSSSSSTVNLNKLTGLTASSGISDKSENLWAITELHKIPDLGEARGLSCRNESHGTTIFLRSEMKYLGDCPFTFPRSLFANPSGMPANGPKAALAVATVPQQITEPTALLNQGSLSTNPTNSC